MVFVKKLNIFSKVFFLLKLNQKRSFFISWIEKNAFESKKCEVFKKS